MNLFIYPLKDATIYKERSRRELNYGNAEILEIINNGGKTSDHNLSQILIQFDIPIDIDTYNSYSDFRAELKLKITHVENLEYGNKLMAYPINCPWVEGTGAADDYDQVFAPVNWIYSSDTHRWEHDNDSERGATYFKTKLDCCGNLKKINSYIDLKEKTSDIDIDITDLVSMWVRGDIENNGIVLKLENEANDANFGSIKFFSSSTNTIYSPRLKLSYTDFTFLENLVEVDDSTDYISGSLGLSGTLESGTLTYECDETNSDADYSDFDVRDTITESCENHKTFNVSKIEPHSLENISGELFVKIKDIKKNYKTSEIIRFRVGVRSKNPVRKIRKKAVYSSNYYTSDDIYYSIIDAETQEIIIDFDKYSQVSCGEVGHYFDVMFNSFSPGRYYKFLLMVSSPSGQSVYEETRTFHLST
jgi:hypothetical protein